SHSIAAIVQVLAGGGIVALKGIGGYHLACDARNAAAITALRRRKQRDGRPFAVMMLNARSAAREITLEGDQRSVLASPERPIVIAERTAGFSLPDGLAPGLNTLGVMLPYTALHYLLFHTLEGSPEHTDWLETCTPTALVMTSANRSGEPMITDDREAGDELAGIADLIVSHNRRIARGCDDSVLRTSGDRRIMLRRSRGFAPGAIALPETLPSVLALGAHLKNTICATRGNEAFLSAHHGDLDSAAMHRLLDRSSRDLRTWLGINVDALACDLHPDYASTRLAERLAEELDVPLIRVQHHHAHIAAMLAARGHEGPALGLALDGHGFGADGESWGGELLFVDREGMRRLGHLRPLPLPGGDRAAREPWRIAVALAEQQRAFASLPEEVRNRPAVDMLRHFAASGLCPTTTACGRYFDAAAALLGVCHEAGFEAEAPMRLEAQCRSPRSAPDLYRLNEGQLDLHPLLMHLGELCSAREGAELFHGTLVDALTEWVGDAVRESGVNSIALGGGCFLNAVLARELPRRLRAEGMTVIADWEAVTPGDGSIALGQAWIAAHALNIDKENPGGHA
ncbi:MAG: Sua5/YciO/YrdC/YwlC family protein, partial [Pseudomonadota bacterium]